MELRVLHYFLAVAREQSISKAAESLHLSQPTLSTQLKNMEEELGKQLMIRGTKGSRKIVLTDEGMLLRKRAEEILELVRKTENEIMLTDETIVGDVFIGTGETDTIRLIAKTAQEVKKNYPEIHYHISSGNARYVMEKLDNIICIKSHFFWDDLGAFSALGRIHDKDERSNVIVGNVYTKESNGNIIINDDDGTFIAIDGVNDLTIVKSEGVLLIYPNNKDSKIKDILKDIREKDELKDKRHLL